MAPLPVSVIIGGKIYNGTYSVHKGMVTVFYGLRQATSALKTAGAVEVSKLILSAL